MIPKDFITEWQDHAPWPDMSQVEQTTRWTPCSTNSSRAFPASPGKAAKSSVRRLPHLVIGPSTFVTNTGETPTLRASSTRAKLGSDWSNNRNCRAGAYQVIRTRRGRSCAFARR